MRIVLLMWPDTFEDWYEPLGIDRATYLGDYDAEWTITATAAMRDAGADVHVVHGTRRDPGIGIQRASGVTTHFVPVSPVYRALRTLVWGHRHWERMKAIWPVAPVASTFSPRLLVYIKRLRPDAVVIQDYETLRFDVAAPLLRILGCRVVAIDTGGSTRPSAAPWKRATTRCAHRLLAVHEAEAERARRQRGHPDVAVWPVPVRTDAYTPGDRRAARKLLGVDPATRVVLSVGRLHPVKGLHDLAAACAPLDCDLVLIGSGAEHTALAALGDPRLRLLGRLTTDEVSSWYVAADVVALASHQEGQPIAVMEALACGRGVVATNVGGVSEVVEDGVTGWLVPARDVVRLRAAIASALADTAVADARGAAGRDLVLARHSPITVGRELVRLIMGSAPDS